MAAAGRPAAALRCRRSPRRQNGPRTATGSPETCGRAGGLRRSESSPSEQGSAVVIPEKQTVAQVEGTIDLRDGGDNPMSTDSDIGKWRAGLSAAVLHQAPSLFRTA